MSTGDRLEVACPSCSSRLALSTAHAGKAARCPKCQSAFRVPSIEPAISPQPTSIQSTAGPHAAAPPSGPRPTAAPPAPRQSTQPQIPVGQVPPQRTDAPQGPVATPEQSGPFGQPGFPAVTASSSGNRSNSVTSRRRRKSSVDVGSILTGLLMMVGSVVWLVAGLMAGYFYPYPIVLFVIGIITICKGLMGGGR